MMKEERLAGFDGADDDVGDILVDIVDIVDDSVVIILMILLIYGTSRAPFWEVCRDFEILRLQFPLYLLQLSSPL